MDSQRKEGQWLLCPNCRGKTKIKVYEDTVLLYFPLYCTFCRKEFDVSVMKFRMVVGQSKPSNMTTPSD